MKSFSASILLIWLFLLPGSGLAATFTVPGTHAGIQQAINAAVPGDTVVVYPGTYGEHINFLGKAITVKSAFGPEVTVIDGSGSGSIATFASGEGSDSVLEGFTLTGGAGTLSGSDLIGGGILCKNSASPRLIGNIITENTADLGGGLFASNNAKPYLLRNIFKTNQAEYGGAANGQYNAAVTFKDNEFTANQADYGGAVYGYSADLILQNNLFSENTGALGGGAVLIDYNSDALLLNNTFRGNRAPGGGGGAVLLDLCEVSIRNNTFSENKADRGGALTCNWCTNATRVENNVICLNEGTTQGGGMDCFGLSGGPVIRNNLIYRNTSDGDGGGLHCFFSDPEITNNTFYKNTAAGSGGGIYFEGSNATVTNSILWRDGAASHPEISDTGGNIQVNYSLVRGGWPGTGNLDRNPRFVDGEHDDFHLRQLPLQPGKHSPCQDAGDPGSVVIHGSTRTDGFQDQNTVDMGYHYPRTLFVSDEFVTVQAAILAAQHGDTVSVSAGTYTENLDFQGKAIAVISAGGPVGTVLEGHQAGSVVSFHSHEGSDSRLEGFTLTKGLAYHGGGILCDGTSPVLAGNVIADNIASASGGGIGCIGHAYPRILGNVIQDNDSAIEGGGGIGCHDSASPLIGNNTIVNNVGNLNAGGGIFCSEFCAPRIAGNLIQGNTSPTGGGVACYFYSFPVLDANRIELNHAGDDGGGGVSCSFYSSAILTNNLITKNTSVHTGGGIYCRFDSDPVITNNTLCGNTADLQGGGIGCDLGSAPTVANTVLWDNGAPTGPEIWLGSTAAPSTLDVSYSDLKGGPASVHVDPGCILIWGAGMINLDPVFVDPPGGDYHLHRLSPCIDAGDNSAPGLTERDVDGDPRVINGRAPGYGSGAMTGGFVPGSAVVDLGADEYYVFQNAGTLVK